MPPTRDHPPDLLRRFSTTHPLDWGTPYDTADIARRHGPKATRKALRLLDHAAAAEPGRTADFLASLPRGTSAYQLNRRVKSPESLARKIRTWAKNGVHRPMDDILRYTVLVERPEQLVEAARRTVDRLAERGWRVRHAMHSYTEGSRYKGIHAHLEAPDSPRIEVQFHSVPSLKVKEMTTPWYEIERSVSATADERAEARDKCVAASESLRPPAGIDELTTLGGRRVAVNNYSDSQQALANSENAQPGRADRPSPRTAALKNDGVGR